MNKIPSIEMTVDELQTHARYVEDRQRDISDTIKWIKSEQSAVSQVLESVQTMIDEQGDGDNDMGDAFDPQKMIEGINIKMNHYDAIIEMLEVLMRSNEMALRVLVSHIAEAITTGNDLEQQWSMPAIDSK